MTGSLSDQNARMDPRKLLPTRCGTENDYTCFHYLMTAASRCRPVAGLRRPWQLVSTNQSLILDLGCGPQLSLARQRPPLSQNPTGARFCLGSVFRAPTDHSSKGHAKDTLVAPKGINTQTHCLN